MGIVFNTPNIKESSPKGVPAASVVHAQKDSHLSSHGSIFDVSKAFESEHGGETGTIISDRRRRRASFSENMQAVFSEWWAGASKKIEKSVEALPILTKEEPTLAKAETRAEIVQEAAKHSTIAPHDDHKIVLEKFHTFKSDVARITGTPTVVLKEPEKKKGIFGGWTHVVETPNHASAQNSVVEKTKETLDMRHAIAPVIAQKIQSNSKNATPDPQTPSKQIEKMTLPATPIKAVSIATSNTAPKNPVIIPQDITPQAKPLFTLEKKLPPEKTGFAPLPNVTPVAPKVVPPVDDDAPTWLSARETREEAPKPEVVNTRMEVPRPKTLSAPKTEFAPLSKVVPVAPKVVPPVVDDAPTWLSARETREKNSNLEVVPRNIISQAKPLFTLEKKLPPEKTGFAPLPNVTPVAPKVVPPVDDDAPTWLSARETREEAPKPEVVNTRMEVPKPVKQTLEILKPAPTLQHSIVTPIQLSTDPHTFPEEGLQSINTKRSAPQIQKADYVSRTAPRMRVTLKTWFIFGGIVALGVVLALSLSIYVNFFKGEPSPIYAVSSFFTTSEVIGVPLEGDGTGFATAFTTRTQSTSNESVQIYPVFQKGDVLRPASSKEFFMTLKMNVPRAFLTSLDDAFMMGVVTAKKPEPFLIIRSYNFDELFAGLLAWEGTMQKDLMPLFGTPQGEMGVFTDAVASNKSTRILKNTAGEEVLVYSFINKNTVIITTNGEALAAIISKF